MKKHTQTHQENENEREKTKKGVKNFVGKS